MVEMLSGSGDAQLDEVYGEMVTTIDIHADYRMYICGKENGVPNNKWVDVTGTGQYAKIGDKITWLVDGDTHYTLLRSNRKFLCYDLKLKMDQGELKFSLTHFQTRAGNRSKWVMQVPMGEWDVVLNGHSLSEGIDYVMKFPEVVIISKQDLFNPLTDEQRITVRGVGFCKEDLTYEKPKDVGFIEYGVLSHNNRFDIRDDKVMRLVVGGQTYNQAALKFSEGSPAVTVPDAKNGMPYMLRDITVPMRGKTLLDTYTLREQARVVDQRISDYMTAMLPEAVPTTPNVIAQRYAVFSPFLCKIIYDLLAGTFDKDELLTTAYNDNVVMELCAPYEYLLKFDPTQEGLRPDANYVVIHPHNLPTVIDVSLFHYRFITRVVRLYLNDAVEISHFLTLST